MIEPNRILEGIAHTLEQSVLPALQSGFARGQLFAALEALDGLQGQLRWGGMLLDQEAAALSDLLEQAATVLDDNVDADLGRGLRAYSAGDGAPLEERLREGRRLVCALIEAGHADGGELASAIDGYLANDTILKAMALRPSRLAEISQG